MSTRPKPRQSRPARAPSRFARRLPWVVLGVLLALPVLGLVGVGLALPLPEPPPRVAAVNQDEETASPASVLFAPRDRDQTSPAALRLVAAPDDNLLERTARYGALPRISVDGRRPWRAYARPTDPMAPDGPKVAIIVAGLGLMETATIEAINRLPADVTLSFHAANDPEMLGRWLGRARQAGHEALLGIPVQSGAYPRQDPGPGIIQVGLNSTTSSERLKTHLGRTQGYVGLMPTVPMGDVTGGGLTDPGVTQAILTEARLRGLMVVVPPLSDNALAPAARAIGTPHAQASLILDAPDPDPDTLEVNLARLAELARIHGSAIGIIRPYPVSVEAVRVFSGQLESSGVRLVPLTDITVPDRL